MGMNKLIVSNWKMAPSSLAEAQEILDSVNDYLGSVNEAREFSLVFCPPFVFLEEVGKMLDTSHLKHQSALGAQDIFWDDQGADTGEVSGPMLKKLGVEYVITGHSERRWKLGESNETVNKKIKAALRNELVPIVCIGEKERGENFKDFLKEQTMATFAGLSADDVGKCWIAYEPVWAISSTPSARPDTPESALESIEVIRSVINTGRFLYGGSVNSSNVSEFISKEGIDGVLVGGASTNKEEFQKLLAKIL